jgi:sporulation protein YlmC with PRC-barrel domain
MLRSLKDLERYTVSATDGDIGTVVNFLFDDRRWGVRYLVVETNGFFDGRRVLLSPMFFRVVDWSTQRFHVALTRQKVEDSPSIDLDNPVSREHEWEYYSYYGYPYYWDHAGVWGAGDYPSLLANRGLGTTGPRTKSTTKSSPTIGSTHLRSASEVRAYHIHATDGAIGHLEDFIVDDETWQIRYLVLNTSNWWIGKKVLVAPDWATSISWEDRIVYLDMSKRAIKSSPEWFPSAGINRQYEVELYDYYGRPAYWGNVVRPPHIPIHAPTMDTHK